MSVNHEERLRDIRNRIARLRKELNYSDNYQSEIIPTPSLIPQITSPAEKAKADKRNAEMQDLKNKLLGKMNKQKSVA